MLDTDEGPGCDEQHRRKDVGEQVVPQPRSVPFRISFRASAALLILVLVSTVLLSVFGDLGFFIQRMVVGTPYILSAFWAVAVFSWMGLGPARIHGLAVSCYFAAVRRSRHRWTVHLRPFMFLGAAAHARGTRTTRFLTLLERDFFQACETCSRFPEATWFEADTWLLRWSEGTLGFYGFAITPVSVDCIRRAETALFRRLVLRFLGSGREKVRRWDWKRVRWSPANAATFIASRKRPIPRG